MPLVLEQAIEKDLPRIRDIQFAAFATDAWENAIMPNGGSKDTKAKSLENARKDFKKSEVKFVKIMDTDLDSKIIAFGKWHIFVKGGPESEWKGEDTREWGEGVDVEAASNFMHALYEKRRKYCGGKPHIMLSLLDTDPKHQRRGAGSMLVQWGSHLADKEGLFCYLEASTAGYPLYRKNGFEDVDYIENDLTKYGKEGVYRHVCMVFTGKQRYVSGNSAKIDVDVLAAKDPPNCSNKSAES